MGDRERKDTMLSEEEKPPLDINKVDSVRMEDSPGRPIREDLRCSFGVSYMEEGKYGPITMGGKSFYDNLRGGVMKMHRA